MSTQTPTGPRARTPRDETAARRSRAAHRSAAVTFLRRALAVCLVIVAQGFAAATPHPPSPALGFAYAASALCLVVGGWRLWWPTMR